MHYKLELNGKIKKNKNFIKSSSKNIRNLKNKYQIENTTIHDKKNKHVKFFNMFFLHKKFLNINKKKLIHASNQINKKSV